MRISDEVIKSVEQWNNENNWTWPDLVEYSIQAYLSEIWKPFDAEDVSKLEIDKEYLVRCVYHDGTVRVKKARFDNEGWWRGNGIGLTKFITHYLDPADILPKEDK